MFIVVLFPRKLIFFPDKLDKNFRFSFNESFDEINIKNRNGDFLHGLLFKSNNSKGLIFYLHGNAGALNAWGMVANTYTSLNYDVFLLDYSGYGKSEGVIRSQTQLFNDVQLAYDELKQQYKEKTIVVLGYSIGTGLAAKLASANTPNLLILQAPYYSLSDVMRHKYPIIPTFLLKYRFQTNKYIQECKMPVVIFHGNQDEVIDYGSSLKLKEKLKAGDTLITLNGQGHNGMTNNPEYINALRKIL